MPRTWRAELPRGRAEERDAGSARVIRRPWYLRRIPVAEAVLRPPCANQCLGKSMSDAAEVEETIGTVVELATDATMATAVEIAIVAITAATEIPGVANGLQCDPQCT
mmetsp:Transcript_49319/g.130722  ORF Transcript_49319/g.130722 Transcript_49319/m.130722 type:complete len:108 (+) Transcript_49319:1028-1351(+)